MAFSALPLVVVLVALLLRAGPLFSAGLGLLCAIGAALGGGRLDAGGVVAALGHGSWLAWHAIAVMCAGLFFYTLRHETNIGHDGPRVGLQPIGTAFFLGTFIECATGFGLGYIFAMAALMRSGMSARIAAVLGVFSQALVPWGALAVGTKLGAHLGGIDPDLLSLWSAFAIAALLPVWWILFEWFARRLGLDRAFLETVEDGCWIAGFGLLLLFCAYLLPFDVAGLTAALLALVCRYVRDVRPSARELAAVCARNWDYGVLVAILLAVRLVPGVAAVAKSVLVIDVVEGMPAFHVLSNPAGWLVLITVLARFLRGVGLPRQLLNVFAQRCPVPVGVTLLFVALAVVYVRSGMARDIAVGVSGSFGPWAIFFVGPAAAIAGGLTASNVGSNALMMPIIMAIAPAVPVPFIALAALQNAIGSAFTMVAPARVAMGESLIGNDVQARAMLRRACLTIALCLIAAAVAISVVVLLMFE